MVARRLTVVLVLAAGMSLVGACSTTGKAPRQAEQSAAVARWNLCIERFSDVYDGSRQTMGPRANAYCEGHRRDVVSTFPRHLENQIDTLLSQRAAAIMSARMIRTTAGDLWTDSKGAQVDTLRMRVMEARSSDL
ncbi:MAG: hypothetical protein HKN42_09945 [Granulosicoccus sp.]|nr:hypothetical protein [Granulosicoccus sp.]